MHDLGFARMEGDWGVFVATIAHHILILASHVDSCMVAGSSLILIKAFKGEIGSRCRITDLGPISWLLGMKVPRDRKTRKISLSQVSSCQSHSVLRPRAKSLVCETFRIVKLSVLSSTSLLVLDRTSRFPPLSFSQLNANPGWDH